MLSLHLHQFMGHQDLKISIPRGKVTLIAGQSEAGKTSILCAIRWALYGNLYKVQRGSSGKVWVRLIDDDFEVYRQARPGKLEVTFNGVKQSNKAAQSVINDYYHGQLLWQTVSLIEQKKWCLLLQESNKNQLKILTGLSSDDDPKKEQDKIVKFQETLRLKYKTAISKSQRLQSRYETLYKTKPDDISIEKYEELLITTQDSIKLNQAKIEQLQTEVTTLSERKRINEIARTKSKKLEKQLEQYKTKLESIDSDLVEIDVDQLRANIKQLQQRIGQINSLKEAFTKYTTLATKVATIKVGADLSLSPDQYSDLYIYQIEQQSQKYRKCITTLRKYRLKNTKSSVFDRIEKLKQQLKQHKVMIPRVDLLTTYLNKVEAKGQIGTFVSRITLESINDLQNKYQELKQGINVLKCPICETNLRLHQSHLVKDSHTPVKQEQLDTIKAKIKQYQQQYRRQEQYDKLEEEITFLKEKIGDIEEVKRYEPINLSSIHSELAQLQNLELVTETEHDITVIKSTQRYHKLKQQLESLEQVEEPPTKHKLETELRKLQQQLKLSLKASTKYQTLVKRVEQIQSQLNTIECDETVSSKLVQAKTELKSLKEQYNKTKLGLNRLKDGLKYQKASDKVKDLGLDLEASQALLSKAVNLQCSILEQLVQTISDDASKILLNIFDKTVRVEIDMFKNIKSRKITKQSVNFNIYFNDVLHDKRLCGGETDRISIALLLALNKQSKSPFIMMDEVLGTVSASLAKKCVKEIRKFAKGKYILCVEHKVVAGNYDHVIQL